MHDLCSRTRRLPIRRLLACLPVVAVGLSASADNTVNPNGDGSTDVVDGAMTLTNPLADPFTSLNNVFVGTVFSHWCGF